MFQLNNMSLRAVALFSAQYLQQTQAETRGVVTNSSCSCTVTIDGEEVQRPCTTYEHADHIKHNRAHGRIVTSSGAELRQYPELTKWLVSEQHLKYHNLDLDVVFRKEPTLQVFDPKTRKVTHEVPLGEHGSKDSLEALLASLDFEKDHDRSDL